MGPQRKTTESVLSKLITHWVDGMVVVGDYGDNNGYAQHSPAIYWDYWERLLLLVPLLMSWHGRAKFNLGPVLFISMCPISGLQ